jgi:outer membrane protein, multidrug efflux system
MERFLDSTRSRPLAAFAILLGATVSAWTGISAAQSSPEPQAVPSAPEQQLGPLAPGTAISPPEPSRPIIDPDLAPLPPPPRVLASWEQALALVRSQSPVYGSSYANVERARAQARIALGAVLPVLAGQAVYDHEFETQTLSFGGSSFVIPPQNTLTVNGIATWALLSPRAIYGLGTASRNVKSAGLGFAEARRQIATSLVQTMLGTLAAARVAELNRVGLRAALERLLLTQTKLQFRQGTPLDVDRAQQDVAVSRSQLINGDEALRRAREALGLAVGSSVPISAPGDLNLDDFEKAVAATCKMSEDVERRPDVAAARAQVELADRVVADAKLQFVPSLAVQSQASYSTQVTFGPRTLWNLQAVLSVPLFDETRFGTVHAAGAARDQARAALVSTRLNALVDIARTQRSVGVTRRQYEVAGQQRELAARIDQRTREGYAHGLGTSLDLVTSAQSLRQAEINLILSAFQASQARVDAVLANAECVY